MVLNQAAPTREAIMEGCERFLGGHGPMRPHDELAALAAATSPDEDADVYGKGGLIEDFECEIASSNNDGRESAELGKHFTPVPLAEVPRRTLFRQWLELRRHETANLPGAALNRAFHLTRIVIWLTGILLGASSAGGR